MQSVLQRRTLLFLRMEMAGSGFFRGCFAVVARRCGGGGGRGGAGARGGEESYVVLVRAGGDEGESLRGRLAGGDPEASRLARRRRARGPSGLLDGGGV